jgi:hypothetical protein
MSIDLKKVKTVRIFISSTFRDVHAERVQVSVCHAANR